ncbi:hypothetical protein [Kitasatospora sp. NPDC001132]
MSRQFPRTAVALAVLASGPLTAWNAPLAAALRHPDAWPSAEAPDVPALTVPTITVPADTDDPGLRLTGTGEAGGIVSVVDQDSGDDLCITGVPADGRWSCLPVEDLADGPHLLTPFAVDVAGGRTPGPPGELVVATGLPERPVLTSPAPGEFVRVRGATGGATPTSSPSVAVASSPAASRPAEPSPGATGSAVATSSPSVAAVPAVAPSRATSPTVSTRPAVPAPSATATVSPTPTPARAPAIGLGASPVPAAVVEPGEPAARPSAAPVVAAQGWSGRPGADGWRGGLAGVLLVLTGLGLITRRVFAHRNGAPRR